MTKLPNNPIKLIIGLGNPGEKYEETRHNAGFWFIDSVAKQYNIQLKFDNKFKAITGNFNNQNNQKIYVIMPQDFMNLSGTAVQLFCSFYKIQLNEILVAHDELDYPTGTIKIKYGGGAGGHNGIKDIINKLGSNNFYRIRIGIDHPRNINSKIEVHNYVLATPNNSDKQKIKSAIDSSCTQLDNLFDGEIEQATKNINSI